MNKKSLSLFLLLVLAFTFTGCVNGKFPKGRWRSETVTGTGIPSDGDSDRKGDHYYATSIEYEWLQHNMFTVGCRILPALYYVQDKNNRGKNDEIFASGIGIALRKYWLAKQKGLYTEFGSGPIYNSKLFSYNDAHWNFLTEVGIGYMFDSRWHFGFKYQHISNAETNSPNRGMNALAICAGFTF